MTSPEWLTLYWSSLLVWGSSTSIGLLVCIVFVFDPGDLFRILLHDEVFNLLQRQGETCRGTRSLTLLEHPICSKGFMRILSIGKHRFATISSAVRSGQSGPPIDQRFTPRAPLPQTHKRSVVHDFLYGLYEQCAESLPDLHHSSSNKRPRRGALKFDDKTLDRTKLRFLPPGKIMDYLRLCRAENPEVNISSKLFASVGVHSLRISERIMELIV